MTEATEDLDSRTAGAIATALALERGDTVVAAAIAPAIEASLGAALLEGVAPAVAMAAMLEQSRREAALAAAAAAAIDVWSRVAMAPSWPSPVSLLRRS